MNLRRLSLLSLPLLFTSAVQAGVDYQTQIRPILLDHCFECHGGPDAKKDFRMDVPEKFQEHIGPEGYIIPGDSANSLVIELASLPYEDEQRMPPRAARKSEPLEHAQLVLLAQWIDEGASFEEGGNPEMADAPATPAPPAVDATALHTWTAQNGDTLQAYFVRVEGANVVLRAQNGEERPFPMAVFGEESQALIQQLVAATEG